jgi:putative tricarboxylic transport membrane protein
MLSLGIPANAIMALLLGALMIYGVQPGPLLIKEQPDLFWGLVSSMYIGNVMLLILNLPLIPLWVQMLKIPYHYLGPMILLFCLIGSYTLNNNVGDVLVMVLFGGIGLLMRYFGFEAAPLILAMVLGPLIEDSLRQSLIISRGDFSIFISRPISAGFLIVTMLIFCAGIFRLRPPSKVRVDEE